MKSFNGLSWVQKSLYRSLVPPGPDELKRPRRPCMWACVAYTTAGTSSAIHAYAQICTLNHTAANSARGSQLCLLCCGLWVPLRPDRVSRVHGVRRCVLLAEWSHCPAYYHPCVCVRSVPLVPSVRLSPCTCHHTGSLRWWEVLTKGTCKQIIPDFCPADSHHFQKLVLNDGGPTALTAVLVANSVRSIDEVEAAWDDDEEYTERRFGKPLPGAATTHLPLPGVVKLKPSTIDTGGAQRAPRPPKSPARPPSTTSTLLSSRQSPAVLPSDALVDRGPTPPTFTSRRVLRAKNHPGQLRPAAFDVLPSPRQSRRGLTARSQPRAESRLSRASRSPATFDTDEATAVSFTLDAMSSSDSLSISGLHDVQTTSRRGHQ